MGTEVFSSHRVWYTNVLDVLRNDSVGRVIVVVVQTSPARTRPRRCGLAELIEWCQSAGPSRWSWSLISVFVKVAKGRIDAAYARQP